MLSTPYDDRTEGFLAGYDHGIDESLGISKKMAEVPVLAQPIIPLLLRSEKQY